ncbi:MAG: hydroxyisourate hydrolase [Ktedonobacteraceae bacterium]
MAGRLTTHVLDIARGCPASDITIELWRRDPHDEGYSLLKTVHTNTDGRTHDPLLANNELIVGIYELVFVVGKYFATQEGTNLPFLDRIPIRFGISDATAHYHIPLLVSPWAYSTYRGS